MRFFCTKTLAAGLFLMLAVCAGCHSNAPSEAVSNQPNKAKTPAITRVSATATDAAEPAIAADANGNVYVVYVEHSAEKSADVYLQKFDADAKPLGERTRVNSESGKAKAWFGDSPTIKIGGDNQIYIGWTRTVETSKTTATDLMLSVSRDSGKTFDQAVKVNDDLAPASHGMHSLAVGADNKIFMAWLDERNLKNEARAESIFDSEFQIIKAHHKPKENEKAENTEPNSEVFFAVSNDGGRTFAANKKLSSEVCPCCKTTLAVAPDNKIYASWRQVVGDNFRHIAVAVSNDNGANFSKPTVVSDDQWQLNACPVSGAAMAFDALSQLQVAWFTAGIAGEPGIYQAASKDAGATFSSRIKIFDGMISGQPIFLADKDKSLRVFWEADGKIMQTRLSANGVALPAETVADGSSPAITHIGDQIYLAFLNKEAKNRVVQLTRF